MHDNFPLVHDVSQFGFTVVACAIFLTLSATLMTACFRWLRTLVDRLISRYDRQMNELLDVTRRQNGLIAELADALRPASLEQARILVGAVFENGAERVARAASEGLPPEETTGETPQAALERFVGRVFEDHRRTLSHFRHGGRKLSEVFSPDWPVKVARSVRLPTTTDDARAALRRRSAICAAYEAVKRDFFLRLCG